jgi:hypothetical protein
MSGMSFVPLSALELRDAVRNSKSYDPLRLDRILRVEEDQGLVEVQANSTWKALGARLRPKDARAASARTTMPTVGESIARNAAGPDGRTAVTHVESLTLVTPDGELRRVSRYSNPRLFSLAVGGQGLFGACYSVTLRVDSLARALEEAAPGETLQPAGGGARGRMLHLLVPPERLDLCMAQLHAHCAEWRSAIESVELRRIREESETYLRWASRDYAEIRVRLAQPGSLAASVRATQLARGLLEVAIAHGGSFPIACTPEATRSQVEACYPQLKSFLAEKRQVDPLERLTNPWYRHFQRMFTRNAREPAR